MPSKTTNANENKSSPLYQILSQGGSGGFAYRLTFVEGTPEDEPRSLKVMKTKRTISGAPNMFAKIEKEGLPDIVYIASLRLYCTVDVFEALLDESNPHTGKLMTSQLREWIQESAITSSNVGTSDRIVTQLSLVQNKNKLDATKNSVVRMPVSEYLGSLKKTREAFKFAQVLLRIASLVANVDRKLYMNVAEGTTTTKTRKICVDPAETIRDLNESGRDAEISNLATTIRSIKGDSVRVWTGITSKKRTEGNRHISSLEIWPGIFVSSCTTTKDGTNKVKEARVINSIALYQAWLKNKKSTFNDVMSASQLEEASRLFHAKLNEHKAAKQANEKARASTTGGKKGKSGKKAAASAVPRAKSSPLKVVKPAAEEETDDESDQVVSPKKSPSPVTGKSRAAITTPVADESDDESSDDESETESPKPVTPQGARLAALNKSRAGKTGK